MTPERLIELAKRGLVIRSYERRDEWIRNFDIRLYTCGNLDDDSWSVYAQYQSFRDMENDGRPGKYTAARIHGFRVFDDVRESSEHVVSGWQQGNLPWFWAAPEGERAIIELPPYWRDRTPYQYIDARLEDVWLALELRMFAGMLLERLSQREYGRIQPVLWNRFNGLLTRIDQVWNMIGCRI